MVLVSTLVEIFQRPSIGDVIAELMMVIAPLWIAVLVGVLVGWSWKPKWANLYGAIDSSPSSSSLFQQLSGSIPSLSSLKLQLPTFISDNSSINKEGSSSMSATGCRLVPTLVSIETAAFSLVDCLFVWWFNNVKYYDAENVKSITF